MKLVSSARRQQDSSSMPQQLSNLLHPNTIPPPKGFEGRSGIDPLYTQVLDQVFCDVDLDGRELYSHFRTVVGTAPLGFNPLPMEAPSTLLRIPNISTTLCFLHSLNARYVNNRYYLHSLIPFAHPYLCLYPQD